MNTEQLINLSKQALEKDLVSGKNTAVKNAFMKLVIHEGLWSDLGYAAAVLGVTGIDEEVAERMHLLDIAEDELSIYDSESGYSRELDYDQEDSFQSLYSECEKLYADHPLIKH